MVHLSPVQPHLGVNLEYVVNTPVTLVLKEKVFSMSGDDFSVKDQNGVAVVVCHGSSMSFTDRKTITSVDGRVLFSLTDKILSLRKTIVVSDAHGQPLFEVKKKFGFGTRLETTFVNRSTGQQVSIELQGEIIGGSATLSIVNGPPIAQISRQYFNAANIFAGQQTYNVVVAPGVDLSLVATLCICFDEARNEK